MNRLTWLGHATVVIDLSDTRLLTDPLLRRHAGPLRRIGRRPDPHAWAHPDAVLISHLHSDHAALGSLRKLVGIPMLTGPANAAWLRRKLDAEAPALTTEEWVQVADVRVRLVRADHSARPMPHRPNDTHGHLIAAPGLTVWFAGDTSLYPEMSDLPTLAGTPIDVALLPIAGWGPRLSPGHMGPRQAVDACLAVGARAVLPIHHGTLHPPGFSAGDLAWMHRPLAEFRTDLAERAPQVRLLDVGLGESVDLDDYSGAP
ncbi:MBL fold metallo-hydrolase [Nocardioides sp.]|uniref:MBL fold metallo-hydrolase n=1 Tax=Nocardioides sp. TaxID=35761 RepID=UPI003D147DF8